jgi:hypothetical protein
MDEFKTNELIKEHFEIWSMRDPEIRSEGIKRLYTPDVQVVAHYVFNGYEKMDDYIENLLTQRPDYIFEVTSPAEQQHHTARVYWRFGPPSNLSRVTGQDFFTFENGKISGVFAFLDRKKQL